MKRSFEDALKGHTTNREPTEAELKVVDTVVRLYSDLQDGNIKKCVTHAVKLFIDGCLPELTFEQSVELVFMVHTMIETTLSYFVEDGLIKEE